MGGTTKIAATPPISGGVPNRQTNWDVYICEIARGDRQAIDQLYGESSHLVYSVAMRILNDRSDAEEAVMDVYAQVWRSAGKFSNERGSGFAWLMNLARSRAIDKLRARRNRNVAMEPLFETAAVSDRDSNPERISALGEMQDRVRTALSGLPAEQRTTIELAFYSGLTHVELAERLGQPLGTVKTRIRAGMMKLRTTLEGLA